MTTEVKGESMSTTTLYEQAYAQEGNPIPVYEAVTVSLYDESGTFVESRQFTRESTTVSLEAFVGEYAVSMVSEGMGGSVSWTATHPADD